MNFHILALLSLLGLSACGGVKKESQIAQALQTLTVFIIEGNIQVVNGDASPTSIPCGDTPAQGTMSYGAGFATIDPTNPGDSTVTFPITFSKCEIKACNRKVVVDGTGASVTLSATDAVPGESKTFSLTLAASNLLFDGVIAGRVSFAYSLNVTASRSTVTNLNLSDSTPPNPLEYQGKTYDASKIAPLTEGC